MRRSVVAVALAAILSCAALAACGGGARSAASGATGRADTSPLLAFTKCMRANGVPTFADISAKGLRIQSTQGPNGQTLSVNGVSVNAPAFRTARRACAKYMPHVDATPAQAAQARRRGLEFAKCMRSHGVPNFPDPKVISSSGSNQQVYLPGINLQSPAVQAGAKACGGGPKGP